jgi:protein-disulfide isomerase
VGAVVGVAILVIVGVVIAVQQSRDDTGAGSDTPPGVVDSYGIPDGDSDAPVEVVVFEDFQCPFCAQFEQALSSRIEQNVSAGTIRVVYRPIAFLDRASTTDYSSRALETAACTLDDGGVDAFLALHTALFANQPPEGGEGLSDDELASMAGDAGADTDAVRQCQDDDTYDGWVKAATDAASKDGVSSTPTYLVDGEALQFSDTTSAPGVLQEAIDAAAQ